MKLYYTTIVKEGVIQDKPNLSLGGFISSSSVPNGKLDNLFGDLSQYTIERQLEEYIAIVLKNETGSTATGVTLCVEYPVDILNAQTNLCKFEVSAVALNIANQMEAIQDRYTMPFNATFYEVDGQTNAVGLGDILDQKAVGLWVKRSFIADRIKLLNDFPTLDVAFQAKIEPLFAENISIKINWN